MEKDDASVSMSDQENPTAQPKEQDFDTYADALWWGLVRALKKTSSKFTTNTALSELTCILLKFCCWKQKNPVLNSANYLSGNDFGSLEVRVDLAAARWTDGAWPNHQLLIFWL